jgi:hypothetical protein
LSEELRARRASLALVVLVAIGLRAYRLDVDVPEVQYVDAFRFVGQAGQLAASGRWQPSDFIYPSGFVYVLVVLYRAFGVVSAYGQHVLAQVVAAVFGVGLVGATAWVATRVSGGIGVVLAAALAAASPVLVTQSRTPAPDTLCAFGMCLAIVVAAGRPVALRSWAGSAATAAVATGAKWTGGFAAPVLAVAAVATAWRERSARLFWRIALVGVLVGVAVLLATSPYLVPLRADYLGALRYNASIQAAGQIGRVQDGWLDYLVSATPTWEAPWLGTSLLSDIGLPALVLAGVGLGMAASGRLGFAGGLYAAVVVGYLLTVSRPGGLKAIRFLVPIIPFLGALAGAAVERALPPSVRGRPLVWLASIALVVGAPLVWSLRYVDALRRPSTNRVVREWMGTHVPEGAGVFLGPFFTDDLRRLPFRFQWLREVGPRQYGLPPEVGPSPERNPIYGPELVDGLRRAGIEYVVLNSYFDGAFARIPENERSFPRAVANHEAFVAKLRREGDLILAEPGWRAGRIGPDIDVWRLRPVEVRP